MKYLVTGGAGFIGTNLVHALVTAGHDVVVVDDLTAGKKERLPKEAAFYQLDVCDTDALTKLCGGVNVIVHLAALPRVQFSIEYPRESQHVNVDGTLSVLEAARAVGVQRIVYAASSSAYGDQEVLPLREDLTPQPKSPYALQKYTGELLLRLWHELHGLETVSLRFFNVYGPHMDPDGAYALVIGKFLKMRAAGETLSITGDGEQTRDFTHVNDLIHAVMLAAESADVGHGEVLNVGAGRNVSINRLAELIGGEVTYLPPRIEPKHTRADITSIAKLLGWKPEITLEEGISALKKEWGITD